MYICVYGYSNGYINIYVYEYIHMCYFATILIDEFLSLQQMANQVYIYIHMYVCVYMYIYVYICKYL
jgi:hypothetical protein